MQVFDSFAVSSPPIVKPVLLSPLPNTSKASLTKKALKRSGRMLTQRDTSEDSVGEKLLQTDDEESKLPRQTPPRWPLLAWKLWAATSTCIVVLLLLVPVPRWHNSHSISTIDAYVYSPAETAVEYKRVVFHDNLGDDTTIYQGPPTDAVDAAWEDLYNYIGISQIDKASAKQLPNKTVPVPGTRGQYIVGLDVFHQLHCLDHIRKLLYPDRYHMRENLTEEAERLAMIHQEHCIDSLRQSIQCSSDISTLYWQWVERRHASIAEVRTTHMCRDFEKIQDWAREHKLGPTWDPTVYVEDG